VATILAITAHPDDECFLFGGALADASLRGQRAGLLCLTDGQAGRTGGRVPRADLGRVRRSELHEAVGVLGIPHVFTPGLLDGGLDAWGDERGAALVREVADDFGADVLLSFGPEGASGHPDHKATWRWTRAACDGRTHYAATFPESAYPLVRGGTPLPVTTVVDLAQVAARKREAFLRHQTQRDHLDLFDRVIALFSGREYYSRVAPPWPRDAAPESILIAGSVG